MHNIPPLTCRNNCSMPRIHKVLKVEALRELTQTNNQRSFDHMFVAIELCDGEDPTKFDKWIEVLKMACYQSGRNIQTKALG